MCDGLDGLVAVGQGGQRVALGRPARGDGAVAAAAGVNADVFSREGRREGEARPPLRQTRPRYVGHNVAGCVARFGWSSFSHCDAELPLESRWAWSRQNATVRGWSSSFGLFAQASSAAIGRFTLDTLRMSALDRSFNNRVSVFAISRYVRKKFGE